MPLSFYLTQHTPHTTISGDTLSIVGARASPLSLYLGFLCDLPTRTGPNSNRNIWKDWAPEEQGGKDLAFIIKLVIEGVGLVEDCQRGGLHCRPCFFFWGSGV